MLLSRTIFAIGVISGFICLVMWVVLIFSTLSSALKSAIFLFGVIACVGAPQAYIYGWIKIPMLERIHIPTAMDTQLMRFRKFGIFFCGIFTPVILSVLVYVLWARI